MGTACCQLENPEKEVNVPGSGNILKYQKSQNKFQAHHAKVFLVTCMDFRLFNDVHRIMKNKGLSVNYDQFVLAGVSLGFCQKKYLGWGKSLLDHINISLKLHKITKIILLDHLDCGAYKTFCPAITNEDEEIKEHRKNLEKAQKEIATRFQNIAVKTWLLHMDGSLDTFEMNCYSTETE